MTFQTQSFLRDTMISKTKTSFPLEALASHCSLSIPLSTCVFPIHKICLYSGMVLLLKTLILTTKVHEQAREWRYCQQAHYLYYQWTINFFRREGNWLTKAVIFSKTRRRYMTQEKPEKSRERRRIFDIAPFDGFNSEFTVEGIESGVTCHVRMLQRAA